MPTQAHARHVLAEVESARDELVALTMELVRVPTINPPGASYTECAALVGRRLEALGMAVEYVEAPLPSGVAPDHPRVNVVGRLEGAAPRPCLHLNAHMDVVPPGEGWTVDPFEGVLRDDRILGRGASDMKSGLAAAIVAVEAVVSAGVELRGSVEVSATADEESGGFAGVAHLCETGRIAEDRTDYVIIPEPFGPARVCVGHKGVYWFDVTAHGRVAHGSMPHLGRSAIDDLAALLEAFRTELQPRLEGRVTAMPVVPEASRRSTLNVNAIAGGQVGDPGQSPCVADRCVATFDRRFIPEETLDEVRVEIEALVRDVERREAGRRYSIDERLVVEPTRAPDDSPLIGALRGAVRRVCGVDADLVASPGTYDQKHVARIAGVEHCVAYGPGPLQEAHQPDESCAVDDIVTSAKVMALTVLELVG